MWPIANDMLWAWVTTVLSVLVACGYCLIAIGWYFQEKLASEATARAALGRMRGIFLACALCGTAFYLTDMPPWVWRFYDFVLLIVAIRTWTFALKMRGPSLVDEHIAHMEELERSATKYRQIAELLPHMVWTAAADGRVDFSNERWTEFAGSDRTWLEAVHPDDRVLARVRWEASLAARQPLAIEARLAGREGYRTFIVRATPIVQGEAVKWLGACADIEDQKLLAAEKETQARQKTFFLNALSHDLRAPLHNVLLNAHLLKMSARDPADVETVTMIMENAVAAGDLVGKLLDYAKVGAQDQNVMESASLASMVQQVARRFAPIAEQKGLYLHVNGVADDVSLVTDRQKLERIMSNLVDNAIKYTTRGGVSLALATSGGEICVRVSDTGCGVPKSSIPYLFDEFYQAGNADRDRAKGFGMGLAICKCLSRHIGGDVRLVSTGSDGSCFEVVLKPLTSEPRPARSDELIRAPLPPVEESVVPPRVLAIDT